MRSRRLEATAKDYKQFLKKWMTVNSVERFPEPIFNKDIKPYKPNILKNRRPNKNEKIKLRDYKFVRENKYIINKTCGHDLKNMKYEKFTSTKYWRLVRILILQRDDYQCVKCGESKGLQAHHKHIKIMDTSIKICKIWKPCAEDVTK